MAEGYGSRIGTCSRLWMQLVIVMMFVSEVLGNDMAEEDTDEKDDVSDYTTGLLSDLAPLLALFGEKFAQQYMSYATSVLDSVLFALVPLGVITAIVGAIRVEGPSWLRSIIGRAREPRAIVELELMSSTSEEVCELWNGNGIVRVMGAPLIQQFVYIEGQDREKRPLNDVFTIQEAVEKGLLVERQRTAAARRFRRICAVVARGLCKIFCGWLKTRATNTGFKNSDPPKSDTGHADMEGQTRRRKAGITKARVRKGVAPNISLNISARVSPTELRCASLAGFAVQAAVIGIAALISHAPQKFGFKSNSNKVAGFALKSYILFAAGSVALCFGMFICAVIVDEGTKETRWQKSNIGCRPKEIKMTLIWIQRGRIINDQVFDSVALFTKKPVEVIRASTRKEHDAVTLALMQWFTVVGTLLSVAGFTIQFIGLRGLHWSVAVIQFVAIIAMGGVRALIRRGITENPLAVNLPKNFELEWLTSVLTPCYGGGDNSLAHKIKEEEEERKGGSRFNVDSHSYPESLTRFEKVSFSIFRYPSSGSSAKEGLRGAGTASSELPHVEASEASDYWATSISEASSSKAPEGNVLSDPKVLSDAERAIAIRETLGRGAEWMGPASDAALALSYATDSVMDSLGTFLSSDGERFDWDLPYCYSAGNQSQGYSDRQAGIRGESAFGGYLRVWSRKLESQSTENWCLHAGRIEAILSMWLYDCHHGPYSSQRHRETQSKTSASRVRISSNEEWNSERFGGQGWLRRKLLQKSIFFLGRDTPRLRRDLRWWIPSSGTKNFLSVSPRGSRCREQYEPEPFHYDIPHANIVGHDVSKFFQKSDMHEYRSPSYDWQLDCRTISYDDYNRAVGPMKGESQVVEHKESYSNIGIVTSSGIELLLAQHLFGLLFDKIVEKVINIRGKSGVFQNQQSTDLQWQNFRLENTTVSQLAVAVQNAGLASTSEEAFQLVIPSLSKFEKLPVEAVVQFVVDRQNSPDIGDWHRSARLYEELFDLAVSGFISVSGTVCRFKLMAIHAIIDYVCQVEGVAEMMLPSREQASFYELLEAWWARLRLNLPKLNDVLRTLEFMYTQQGRRKQKSICSRFVQYQEYVKVPYERVLNDFGCQPNFRLVLDHFDDVGSQFLVTNQDLRFTHDITGYSTFHALLNLDKEKQDFLFGLVSLRIQSRLEESSIIFRERVARSLLTWLNLQSQTNINWQDTSGCTALHYAARLEEADESFSVFLSVILDTLNPDLAIQAKDGATALHYAATYNPEFAAMLVKRKAKIESVDVIGRTPLHWAAMGQSTQAISLLLDHGANPNAEDYYGTTPLHILAFSKEREVVGRTVENTIRSQGLRGCFELLLSKEDLDLAATDRQLRTALHLAALSANELVLRQLLIRGPTLLIDAQDEEGNTVLHLAVMKKSMLSRGVINFLFDKNTGNAEKLRTLKETKNKAGKTPFLLAASQGMDGNGYHIITRAQEFGLDVNAVDSNGNNAIHQAVEAVNPSANHLQLLMKAGVAHHTPNMDGMTPLHLCFHNSRFDLARRLLENSDWLPGQISAVDNQNRAALNIAIEKIQENVRSSEIDGLVKLFSTRGARLNPTTSSTITFDHQPNIPAQRQELPPLPLHHAVVFGKKSFTRTLIRHGSQIHLKDPSSGRTPLHLAAAHGHFEIVQMLITEAQRIVTIRQEPRPATTKEERTPTGSFEFFASVKEYINDQDDEDGSTALALACGVGGCQNLEVARLLIDHGADPNIFDKRGYTLFHAAILSKNTDFSLGLLQEGLVKEVGHRSQTSDGCTSLHLAARQGDHKLVSALVNRMTTPEINTQDRKGRTAVMDTVIYGAQRYSSADAMRFTLRPLYMFLKKRPEAGPFIDLTLQDNDGMTVLQHALDSSQRFTYLSYIGSICGRIIQRYPGGMLILDKRTGQTPLSILLGRVGYKQLEGLVHVSRISILSETLMSQKFYDDENLSKLPLDPYTFNILIFDGQFPDLHQFLDEHQLITPDIFLDCMRRPDQHGWSPWTCIREKYSPIARTNSAELGVSISILYDQSKQILDSEITPHWSPPEFLSNPLLRASRPETTDEDEIQREWSERIACESKNVLRLFDPGSFQKDQFYEPKYNWLIANRPFPPCFTTAEESVVSRYFEVTISNTTGFEFAEYDSLSRNRNTPVNVIIGLSSMSLWGELCSRVGGADYPRRSWVYNGQNGAFETDTTSKRTTLLSQIGWKALIHGDVMGCGITNENDVFFTLNGEYLGVAEHGVSGQLFPLVCVGESCKVKANFGKEEFRWKFKKNLPKMLAQLIGEEVPDLVTSDGSEDENEGS